MISNDLWWPLITSLMASRMASLMASVMASLIRYEVSWRRAAAQVQLALGPALACMCSPRRAPSFTGAARVRGHKGLVEGLTGVDTARGLVGSIAISCLIWKEGPGQIGLDLHANRTGQCVTIARVKPDTPAARSVPPLVAGMTLVSVDGAVVLDAHAAAAAISLAGRGQMVLEVRVPRTARSWLARRQRPEARREGSPSAVLGARQGAVVSASWGALHAEHASGALPSPDNDAEPVAAAPTPPSPQPPSPHPHSPQPLSPPSLSSAHDSAHWLRSSISARSRSRLWSSVSARARRRVEAKAGTSPARDRDRAEIVAASPARPQPAASRGAHDNAASRGAHDNAASRGAHDNAASRDAHDNAASRGAHSISILISRGA